MKGLERTSEQYSYDTITKFPISIDTEEIVYLCQWNGNEIVELHTKDSLWQQYKDTNLFTEPMWIGGKEYLLEDLYSQLDDNDMFQIMYDNFSMRRIK